MLIKELVFILGVPLALVVFYKLFFECIKNKRPYFLTSVVLFVFAFSIKQNDSGFWAHFQSLLKAGILGMVIVYCIPRLDAIIIHLSKNKGYLLFLLYGFCCLVSSIYSITPAYTFNAALGFLAMGLLAGAVMQTMDSVDVCIVVSRTFTLFCLVSVVLYLLVPSIGVHTTVGLSGVGRMKGLAGNPNTLGLVAALGSLATFYRIHCRRISYKEVIFSFIILVTVFIFTESRTSLIVTILPVFAYYFRLFKYKKILLYSSFLAVIVIAWLGFEYFSIGFLERISRSGDIEELFTFTGRVYIWEYVFSEILERPFWGYGYASTVKLISEGYSTKFGWTTGSSHNLFLQSLVTVGVFGTFPLFFLFLFQVVSALKKPNLLRESVFLIVMISGLLEAGAIGPGPNVLTFIWALSLIATGINTFSEKTVLEDSS